MQSDPRRFHQGHWYPLDDGPLTSELECSARSRQLACLDSRLRLDQHHASRPELFDLDKIHRKYGYDDIPRIEKKVYDLFTSNIFITKYRARDLLNLIRARTTSSDKFKPVFFKENDDLFRVKISIEKE